ncbi:MAG: DNA polymerase III subunit delta [Clostridia bacterium]
MTYDEFRNVLKTKDTTPLYFFTGEEDFLQSFCLSESKNALIDPSFEDFNYKCYIEVPTAEEADSFINALPLMSDRKLVIFNNCNLFSASLPEKSKWESIFSNLPEYVVCIVRDKESGKNKKGSVVEQAVKSKAVTVNFEYLPENRLIKWLMKAAAVKGKSLGERDASYIIKNLGRSMTLLKSEIEKISARAEDFVISRNDIDSVIINVFEESIYTLMDAVFLSRREVAFNTLANLKEMGNEAVSILERLASQAIDIYKAKVLMTQKISTAEIKKMVSRNPYAAEKIMSKASKISIENIEKLISLLTEGDRNIKMGIMDPWCALEYIISN